MPWKSASGAKSGKTGPMRSKSIRGQISAPIPIPDPLEEELVGERQGASQNQANAAPGPTNNSPPRSLPGTGARNSAGRSTNPSSIMSTSDRGASRSSKSQAKTQPERKKSTIRTVFSKLFGREKKAASRTSKSSYGDAVPSHPQHRSDPTPDAKPTDGSTETRANSVPVTEYDRALRSHSIGPEDVRAIQSARNSIAAEYSLTRARTGPEAPHAFGARYIGGGKLAGLSPRPASVNERHDASTCDAEDPNEIGRAITSDSRLKRRSRSLSAIPNFETMRPRRHKSDDLQLWRDSYDVDFLSPLSSNFPDEGSDIHETNELVLRPVANQEPIMPAQQFDFGNMEVARDGGEDAAAGAAPLDAVSEADDRTHQLQSTIAQLDGGGALFAPKAEWTGMGNNSMREVQAKPSVTSSSITTDQHSRFLDMHTSSRQTSHHSLSSVNDTLASSGINQMFQTSPRPENRPISENTITAKSDMPNRQSSPFTEEHYATLLGLLETERSARLALEAQVRCLTHQVSVLMKQAAGEDDTVQVTTGFASVEKTSVFDEDDDGEKRYSNDSHSQKLMDDSGFGSGMPEDDDDDESQSFVTPHEEGDLTFGIYADEHEALDEHAPRAISLSQMTMGRMQATVM